MFYSLNGTLIHIEQNVAVIECGGVGYKCIVSMNTQKSLPKIGDKAKLFTFLNTSREGSIELFGFSSENEMSCFKKLISVSGVGPKFGISILSELSPEQVAMAVASKDVKTLTRAQGVGKKVAERIILELSDKLKFISNNVSLSNSSNVVSSSSNMTEAINALTMLGYSPSDAAFVVAKFDGSLPVEELIRLSLKTMAKGL